jgi:hypothetical protein
MTLHIAVSVPGAVASAGVTDLNEAHIVLHQAVGQQELAAEVVRLLFADAVQRLDMGRFTGEIHDSRRVQLHAPGEFVGL